MERFATHDGISLAYEEWGDPDDAPIILLHGFVADTHSNWHGPGIVAVLAGGGHRVLGLDARGHGQSDKPHDPSFYGNDAMARDVSALIDHLSLDQPAVAGYSMGAITTARVLAIDARVRLGILGGVGDRLIGGGSGPDRAAMAAALEADDPAGITDPVAGAFRMFADAVGADRLALAAMQRTELPPEPLELGGIRVPVLVVTGDADTLMGDPVRLAEAIPHGQAVVASGDHVSAIGDPALAQAMLTFLDDHPPG